MSGVVVDASVIITGYGSRDYGRRVASLVRGSTMSAAGLAELLYRVPELYPSESAAAISAAISAVGLILEPITVEDAVRAGELIRWSHQHPSGPRDATLSLGDGFCIALAERLALPILTEDFHWHDVPMRTSCVSPSNRKATPARVAPYAGLDADAPALITTYQPLPDLSR